MSLPPLRQLYGGAVQLRAPASYEDVSQFRQVPDHQEVFADAEHDSSLIVEINQLADECCDATDKHWPPAEYHSIELAQLNDAKDCRILLTEQSTASTRLDPSLSSAVSNLSFCLSETRLLKYHDQRDDQANTIWTMLYCLRLPEQTSDLLLIHTLPIALSATSSSGREAQLSSTSPIDDSSVVQSVATHLPVSASNDASAPLAAMSESHRQLYAQHRALIDSVLASLVIKDYSLFG